MKKRYRDAPDHPQGLAVVFGLSVPAALIAAVCVAAAWGLGWQASPCVAAGLPGPGQPPEASSGSGRLAALSAEAVVYDVDGRVLRASGNVRLEYRDGRVTIRADELALNLDTMEAVASGSVRLVREGQEFTCSRLVYRLSEGSVSMDEPRTALSGEGIRGSLVATGARLSGDAAAYRATDVRVSGCDLARPHYVLVAREVEIEPGVRVVVKDARFVDSGLTLFWWPYLVISLKEHNRLELPWVGYGPAEGFYVNNAYDYYINPGFRGLLMLDYFQRLGVGAGVRHLYSAGGLGRGELDVYWLGASGQGALPGGSYLARWGHQVEAAAPGASFGFAVGTGNFGPGSDLAAERVTGEDGGGEDASASLGGAADSGQEPFSLLWRPGVDTYLGLQDRDGAAYGSAAAWFGAGSEGREETGGVPRNRISLALRAARAWGEPVAIPEEGGGDDALDMGAMQGYELRATRRLRCSVPVVAEGSVSALRQTMPGEIADDYTNFRVGVAARPPWGTVSFVVDDYTPPKAPPPSPPGWPSEDLEDWEDWVSEFTPWEPDRPVTGRLVKAPEAECVWEGGRGGIEVAAGVTAGDYREYQPVLAGGSREVHDSRVELRTTASMDVRGSTYDVVLKATGVGSAYGGGTPRAWVSGSADLAARPFRGLSLRAHVVGRACEGDSPFLFDDAHPYARAVGMATWSAGPLSMSLSSGYDLLWDQPYDVAGRVTVRGDTLRLDAVGRFDSSAGSMDSALLRATFTPRAGARVRLGASYDFDQHRLDRVETDGRYRAGGRWTIEWAAAYDVTGSRLTRGAIGLALDMHCRQIAASYDAVNQRVWLEYRLMAFPSQGVAVGLGREGLLLR